MHGAHDPVEEIKQKLPIEELVRRYVTLKPAGRALKGLCPFHSEKTPSFTVSPERNMFYCFGCQKGGDIFTFLQEIEGLSFTEALERLAEETGTPLPKKMKPRTGKDTHARLKALLHEAALFYQRTLHETPEAGQYLTERGVSPESIARFGIGFAPQAWDELSSHLQTQGFQPTEIEAAGMAIAGSQGKIYDRFRGRIMFPIYSAQDEVVGFSGRILPQYDDGKLGKYINSPETPLFVKSKVLFGFAQARQAIRKLRFALVMEGQLDVVLSHQAGFANAVAASGTAITEEHLTLLKRFTENLVFALDADAAGVSALQKAAEKALRLGFAVKVAALPEGQDPADIVQKQGAAAWKETVKESVSLPEFFVRYFLTHHDRHSAMIKLSRELPPLYAAIANPLERSYFVETIADGLHVSPEAVREALEQGVQLHAEPMPIASAHTDEQKPPVFQDLPLSQKLFLIGQWRNDQALLEWLQNELTPAHWQKLQEKKDDHYFFELETIYPDDAVLQEDVALFKKRLRLQVVKSRLLELASLLRAAQEKRDETQEKELSEEITALQRELIALEDELAST